MIKLLHVLLLLILAFNHPLSNYAQNTLSTSEEKIKASGRVTDEYSNPLQGATVTIVGTDKSISTGANGEFSIMIDKGQVLRFSFITMIPQDIRIQSEKRIHIQLASYDISIGEVVVTGYNQTTTRRTTGSVAVVDGSKLKDQPLLSTDKLLQGKVAGLQINSVSGRPGESAQVRIRGTNTITGNAEPLWVVDGVPLQKDVPSISTSQIKTGDFNNIFSGGIAGINPNDIESVTVLKDASAAAIYGSRAAGGVIVVTTKRGKAGRMSVNYSNYTTVNSKPQRSLNLMNSQQKIAWEEELWNSFSKQGFENGSHFPRLGLVGMVRSGWGEYEGLSREQQDQILSEAGSESTDWFDVLFRNSVSQNHYLSLSGGNERNRYFISAGYATNKGLVERSDFDRYNLSAKIDITPNDRLQIGINTDLAAQYSNGASPNQDLFRYAYFANPYEKPFDSAGNYKADRTFYNLKEINRGGYDIYSPPNGFNILRELNETDNNAENISGTVTANIGYKINSLLRFSGIGSFAYTHNESENINGRYTHAAYKDRLSFDSYPSTRTYGSITQVSTSTPSYMLRGQLEIGNFLKGDHSISSMLGSEIRSQRVKSIFAKRYGYDEVTGNSSIPIPPKPTGSDLIDYNSYINYARIIDALSGQNRSEDAFASFYFATDYNYKRKYTLSLTARTDGSNNFGSDQQFNPTWSAGAAWFIDQEEFFQPLKSVFSNLSIKAATGFTGNVNREVYPQLIMDYLTDFRKTYEDYYRMGRIGNAPNRNLRWEKTQDYKFALDFGIFENRITGLVEYYQRNSTDLVSALRVPSYTGFANQRFNTSSLKNTGVEVTLSGTVIKADDLEWNISGNMAWNRNELTKFSTPTGTVNMNAGQQVGYPLNSIFSGRIQGIDASTGIYTYDLRPDAIINSQSDLRDMTNYVFYLGTADAPVSGGFSTNVKYKQWSLAVSGNFSLGNKIIDEVQPQTTYSSITINDDSSREPIPTNYNDLYLHHLNLPYERSQVWSERNPITDKYPRLIDHFADPLGLYLTNPTSSTITKSSMLKDVSYLRIGALHVGYSLNENWIRKMKLSTVMLNFSTSNLFTFTNYDGIDPETPGAVYPLTRSFSFGLNIGF